MRLAGLVLLLALLALLVGACGSGGSVSGDPDRVLQLGGGETTEREVRAIIRGGALSDITGGIDRLCGTVDGLAAREVADAFMAIVDDPEFTSVPADEERYGEIILEECARLTD